MFDVKLRRIRRARETFAASAERAQLLELFQVQTEQGPCQDCYATGVPVHGKLHAAARDIVRGVLAASDLTCMLRSQIHQTAKG